MSENIIQIANNKKAYHDYFVIEKYEAGLELFGTEIKSIRAGRVNLKDSFCSVDDGEMYVIGMHISPYEMGNRFNRDPMRKKKLLLHKREIMKLFGESQQQGLSIIPLSLYIKNGRAKLEIGLCKGKKLYDKRAVQAKKDSDRAIERAMKGMLEPIYEEKVIGHAEIRQIFKASGIGNIAGSYVLDGSMQRGCKARVTREGKQIFEGPVASLKRFKDDVKEVKAGYECGLVFDGFNEIAEGDQVEAYIMVEVPR